MVDSSDCSALEDLAAFAEGRLRGAERERVIAHLASCADCREVFAETVEIAADLDAEDNPGVVVAMEPAARPARARLRWPARVGALAATVAIVGVVVGWQLHLARTPPSPSDWLAQMPPANELTPHVWGGVRLRGGGEIGELQQQSTEIGALLVDVEVAVQAGDGDASGALQRMATLLGNAGFMEDDAATVLAIAAETEPARMKAAWTAARPALERDLAQRFDELYLPLGSFLEEAQVAARAGKGEFLGSSRIRRHVKWLLSQDLAEPARKALIQLASDTASDQAKAEAALNALEDLTR